MLGDLVGLLRAEPPAPRPPAGKRRPHPRSVTRKSLACERYADGAVTPRPPDEQPRLAADAATADEVHRLRRTIAELTSQCQQQADELEVLRRVCGGPGAPPAVASAATQTEQADGAGGAEMDEELEEVRRESMGRARELRQAQESMRLLQRELQEQRLLSEQFRGQMEALEEQLSGALMRRRREAGEEVAERMGSRSRPASARGSRPSSAEASRRAWEPRRGTEDRASLDLCSAPLATPRSTQSTEIARSRLGLGPQRDPRDSSGEED